MTHVIAVSAEVYEEIVLGSRPFMILPDDGTYEDGDTLLLQDRKGRREYKYQARWITTTSDGLIPGWLVVGLGEHLN